MVEERVVGPGFYGRVYERVEAIPRGKVATYGDIAASLGSKQVARHVGFAIAALPEDRRHVPWHRVVNSKGKISCSGSHDEQIWRLRKEGIKIDADGKIENFATVRFDYFSP